MDLGSYELLGPFLEAVCAACCLSVVPIFCTQSLVALRCMGFFPPGGRPDVHELPHLFAVCLRVPFGISPRRCVPCAS